MVLQFSRLYAFTWMFLILALAAPTSWAQKPATAPTLLEQSDAATQRGDAAAALKLAEQSLAQARAQKDRPGQMEALASLGMRQSPRGDRLTEPTFGPSGRHERLNCCEKNRRTNVASQVRTSPGSYGLNFASSTFSLAVAGRTASSHCEVPYR